MNRDTILKNISSTILPQLKPEISAISEIEMQIKKMVEQQAAYTQELQAAENELQALETELSTALSKALPPSEVAVVNGRLREKKQQAEDLKSFLARLDDSEIAKLKLSLDELRKGLCGRIGVLIQPVSAEVCQQLNQQLQTDLDLLAAYTDAARIFAESVGCPAGLIYSGAYLRPDAALLRRLESQPGWTPSNFN